MATLSRSSLDVLEFIIHPDDVIHFLRTVCGVCVVSFDRGRSNKLTFHELLLKRVLGRKFGDVLTEQLEIDGYDVAYTTDGFIEIRSISSPTDKVNQLLRFADAFWDDFSAKLSMNEFRKLATPQCSDSAWRHSRRRSALRSIVPCIQILGLLQTRADLNVIQREETVRHHSARLPRPHRLFVGVLIRLERDQRRKQDAATPRLH